MRATATLLAVCLLARGAFAASATDAVRIDLDPPSTLGGDAGELVFLSGRALAEGAGLAGLDLVLALDSSDSSDEAAYERDAKAESEARSALARLLSWLGFSKSAEPAPSIFAEQLRAARAVLADLDPRSSRVGIVLLAGEAVGGTGAPVTALPLSSDFARARLILDWLKTQGPGGSARWSAGLRQSLGLLVGVNAEPLESAHALRRRALLVLSDARLAPGEARDPDLDAVLAQAARADVRIDALVFGEEARRGAPLLQRVAKGTGGRTVAVLRERDVLDAGLTLDHARVAGIEVWNQTLSEPARALQRATDGSFGSLVRLAAGGNRIVVVARAWSGRESRVEIVVDRGALDPAADLSALAPASLALRGRLLRSLHEQQLAGLAAQRQRDLRISVEAKPIESLPADAAPAD